MEKIEFPQPLPYSVRLTNRASADAICEQVAKLYRGVACRTVEHAGSDFECLIEAEPAA